MLVLSNVNLCFFWFLAIFFSAASMELFYPGFLDATVANLTLPDLAKITENGLLRLTDDKESSQGHAFYESSVHFKNSSDSKAFSFSTTFVFAIVPNLPAGHGLAFTIASSKNLKGLPAQYLGLLNNTNLGNPSNHVFAVEFDTFYNPYLSDIDDNHVGINLNSMVSSASTPAGYYVDGDTTKHYLNLKSGTPIQAWVDYNSSVNSLTVALSLTSTKPKKPILSYEVDLSPILHEYMYIGFSASTGAATATAFHYVLGWSFSMNGPAQSLDIDSLPAVPGPEKKTYPSFGTGISIAIFFIVIAAVISIAAFVITKAAIFIAAFVITKKADIIEAWKLEIGPHRYPYKELEQATKGFTDKELLGRGGFGKVYKGTLPNSKTQVAVKRISHESKQGLREFMSEITTIGRLRHRNLVQLLGWCRRRHDGGLLLVYDFMANESLDNFIFGKLKVILSWEQRFGIIKGVASGLLYLHEGYEQVVIHRDVKASNVLLDDEMNGKLSDFGLAKLYEHGENPTTTRVVGTLGYLAPELPKTRKATTSSDVYAFGALLLEVACGRRPFGSRAAPEELVLVDWVWDRYTEHKLLEVMDPKLKGEFNVVEAAMILKLGLLCSKDSATARPSMRQVLRFLDGEIGVPDEISGPRVVEGGNSFEPTENTGMSLAHLSTSHLSILNGRS